MFISSPRLCKQWKLSSGENVDVAHINLINVLTADGGFSFKQTIWRGFLCGMLPPPSPDGSQRVWGPSNSENHVKNKTSFSNPKEAALNDQVHGFLRHTFRWISKTCKRGGEAIGILRLFHIFWRCPGGQSGWWREGGDRNQWRWWRKRNFWNVPIIVE